MKNEILKVGDRVMATEDCDDRIECGETGVVCDVKKAEFGYRIGVRWDTEYILRHSCNGHCDEGHGLYVWVSVLQPIWADDNHADSLQVLTLEDLFV